MAVFNSITIVEKNCEILLFYSFHLGFPSELRKLLQHDQILKVGVGIQGYVYYPSGVCLLPFYNMILGMPVLRVPACVLYLMGDVGWRGMGGWGDGGMEGWGRLLHRIDHTFVKRS